MNSTAFCPVTTYKIDEHVARINASVVTLLLLIALITQSVLLPAFLLIDFFLRGVELPKYSPIAIFSKLVVKILKLKAKPINAGPKIFAARIGILFSFSALVLNVLGLFVATDIVLVIFGVCAFLEGAFGFCVACQIYPLVYKFTFSSK